MRTSVSLLLLFVAVPGVAADSDLTGHTKWRLLGQSYPADSALQQVFGSESLDAEADLRLNFSMRGGRWSLDAAYQLLAANGPGVTAPDDDRRSFDLSHSIHAAGDTIVQHRLDRLSFAYASEKTVVRVGRQALSWGNGLFYAPMDLVNPFNPAAIDTEFKAGDDMVYIQHLRENGDDIQGSIVFRRDPVSGTLAAEERTTAIKYHGFAGDNEYDVLLAESYGDTVLGIGGARSVGGAIVRGDIVITETGSDTRVQFVGNLSYSWTWAGRNMSGALEYYFNGFGQHAQNYDPLSLGRNAALLERRARGETFALGRHYLAGSVMIEMTPLWSLTPTVLANAADPSALLQVMTSYSLSDNMTFLGSINLPIGANGSEFGGIETLLPGQYLATDWAVFAQLAWYF